MTETVWIPTVAALPVQRKTRPFKELTISSVPVRAVAPPVGILEIEKVIAPQKLGKL